MQNLQHFRLLLLGLLLLIFSCKTQPKETESNSTWELTGFQKLDAHNPVLKPNDSDTFYCPLSKDSIHWTERNVLNPAAVTRNDTIFLFFRAQDENGTSRIGLATSVNGWEFSIHPNPVLFPDNDNMKAFEWNYKKLNPTNEDISCSNCLFDGVEDPRIVQSDKGVYIMTYTAYDGKTARLAIATSKDLKHWKKEGLAFTNEKYKDVWSKSGAIVTEKAGNDFIAKSIDGMYWMYYGDTNLFLATSEDLVHWEVCENEESKKQISVLHPRPGYFDSRLVEPGPFALLVDEGILLIYNSSNAQNYNDPQLPKFTYSASQALYQSQTPYKLIDRMDKNFIQPDKDYEKVGEVNEVCFVEGLTTLGDDWFLYYGTADSKISVATRKNH